jgi:Fe-S-cluster containining protein
MLLSNADIQRLERKGYRPEFFVRFDKAGYAVLRNRRALCVFFDAEKVSCKVYADRPLGCRVYPVILDEDKGIVVDSVCRAPSSVTAKEKARRGKRVQELLKKVDGEAEKRRFAHSASPASDDPHGKRHSANKIS